MFTYFNQVPTYSTEDYVISFSSSYVSLSERSGEAYRSPTSESETYTSYSERYGEAYRQAISNSGSMMYSDSMSFLKAKAHPFILDFYETRFKLRFV